MQAPPRSHPVNSVRPQSRQTSFPYLDGPSFAGEIHWTVFELCRLLHEGNEIALLFKTARRR